MTDIVERLGYHHEHPVHGAMVLRNPDGPEAAAEIERLRAALREIECGEMTDRPAETRAFARAALGERT